MRRKLFYYNLVLYGICGLLLPHCKTPYDAPLKSTQSNFLVVEGFIDGAAPVTIKLEPHKNIICGRYRY